MARLLSGKVKVTPYSGLSTSRYEFIQLSETEPNAGLPSVDGHVLASDTNGNRFWRSAPGASAISGISVKEEGSIVGTADSVSSLNFVGGNLTASASGFGATVTLSDNPQFVNVGATLVTSTSGIVTHLTFTNLSGTIGTVTTLSGTTGTITNFNSTNLNVTGLSTFSGITTVTGPTLFTNQLSVSGIATVRQLSDYKALVGAASSATETFTVTVANKTSNHRYFGTGSSHGYFIDGKESPFITLVPGKKYRFDQSDNTNSGHPLRFYLEVNKTNIFTDNVTTNGTAGSAGAYTEITIVDTTPIVLHYQCSVHSNMGNAVSNYSNSVDTPHQITGRSGANITGVATITTVDATTLDAGTDLFALSGIVTNFTSTNANISGIATISGLTYPVADGTSNQVLTTNGSGVLTFADAQGGVDKHILPVLTRSAQLTTKNDATMVTISAGINTVIGRFGSNVSVTTNAFVIPRTVGVTTQILIETFFNTVA